VKHRARYGCGLIGSDQNRTDSISPGLAKIGPAHAEIQTPVACLGEINEREKTKFLGDAAALLFPVHWPEPFGLVMIEAMACGTPVLASRCGSVPRSSRMALPAKWSTARKKPSRRYRQSCPTIATLCGNGLKRDSPTQEWPRIMSVFIASCRRCARVQRLDAEAQTGPTGSQWRQWLNCRAD
jgi:hypothetical protein